MLNYWKRNDKIEREKSKKEEKERAEQRRMDEEMREAKRQQRKFNFLITQTELYAHFMQNKLKGMLLRHVLLGDAQGQDGSVARQQEEDILKRLHTENVKFKSGDHLLVPGCDGLFVPLVSTLLRSSKCPLSV